MYKKATTDNRICKIISYLTFIYIKFKDQNAGNAFQKKLCLFNEIYDYSFNYT